MIRKLLVFVMCICSYAFAENATEPKLCLTMIVKNEGKIIQRCLDSVKDLVDYISICDTGSNDNTVEIIETFMRENDIPGKVHHHEWKNFGHNRTLSAVAARQTLADLKAPLDTTYLLLLDADMVLDATPDFSLNQLQDDAYMLVQRCGGLAYYNTRLIRASFPWVSKGVTHEYWACATPNRNTKLATLVIDDREDGGSKADKFERDLKLLTEGLKEEPNNERYMFYCAQTNKCLKYFDEAIKWYKNRIAKGGWQEEVWYSKYMIGEIYEEMGFWDQALRWYLEAYQYRPERAEPLKKISAHYRRAGDNELAYFFATQGSRIPFPSNDSLFISQPAYDYQFDEDISISAFYTKHKDEGFAALNRLLLKKDVPEDSKGLAFRNMLYYVQNLKNAFCIPISIDLPRLQEGSEERYYNMNPSIIQTTDGYALICRTVNFSHNKGEYRSRTPGDETIRTRNYFVTMDKNFRVLSQQEIIEDLPRDRTPWQVQGLEDCRLVSNNNGYYFVAAAYDISPDSIAQVLCKIQPTNDKIVKVQTLTPLQCPNQRNYEKNWLPFSKNDELYVIYSSGYDGDPFTIHKVDENTGECSEIVRYKLNQDFSRFGGSAGPIAFNDGYLALIHEYTFTDQRIYTHRLLWLDKDFNIQKVSKPFTFMHKGIEYCCGMTLDHAGDNLIFSIGIEDSNACLCSVDKKIIESMLESDQP